MTLLQNTVKAHEPNLQVYGKEICTIITIVLSRGTSIATKSEEKMTPRGVDFFNNYITNIYDTGDKPVEEGNRASSNKRVFHE